MDIRLNLLINLLTCSNKPVMLPAKIIEMWLFLIYPSWSHDEFYFSFLLIDSNMIVHIIILFTV